VRIATFVLSLVLPLAVAAGPPDALIETEWKVEADGSLSVWPHPANSAGEHEARLFRPLYDPDADAVGEILVAGGVATWVRILLPGTMDLASQADAQYHFEKLRLGLADADLVHRIATRPEDLASTEPLRRRGRLDRLLAVRLAAERKLADAALALAALRADADADPFLRDAAWEALAALGEPPVPFPARDLPPLLPVLAGLPACADLVVVVNQARVPPWTGLAARSREMGIDEAWNQIERLGASVTPGDLACGQPVAELGSECPYELARRFGNMRVDRLVLAVRFAAPPAVISILDGRFEFERLRAELIAGGAEAATESRELTIRAQGAVTRLSLSPSRLTLVQGDWPGPAGGDLLATELGLAGATRGEAVWALIRRPPPEQGPPLAGLSRATLVASFEGGLELDIEAEYAHEAAAKAGARALEDLRLAGSGMLAGSALAFRTRGPRLVATLSVKAPTATEAFLRLLEGR
jgi:hypothetical protein